MMVLLGTWKTTKSKQKLRPDITPKDIRHGALYVKKVILRKKVHRRQSSRRSGSNPANQNPYSTNSKSSNDILLLQDLEDMSNPTPPEEQVPYAYTIKEEGGISLDLKPKFESTLFILNENQLYARDTQSDSRSRVIAEPLVSRGQHQWLMPLEGAKSVSSTRTSRTSKSTSRRKKKARISDTRISLNPCEEKGRNSGHGEATASGLATPSQGIKGSGKWLMSSLTLIPYLFYIYQLVVASQDAKTDSSPRLPATTPSSAVNTVNKDYQSVAASQDAKTDLSPRLPATTPSPAVKAVNRVARSAAQGRNQSTIFFPDIGRQREVRPSALLCTIWKYACSFRLFIGILKLVESLTVLHDPNLVDINIMLAEETYSQPETTIPRIYSGVDFDEYFSGSRGTISRELIKSRLTSHFKNGIDKLQHHSHDLTNHSLHDAQWGKTLSEPPVVMMAWIPCRIWTPLCVTDYSSSQLSAERKEELEWIVKPVINVCINQFKASRYFIIEQESSSKLLDLPLMKAMIKLTGAQVYHINQSDFGRGHSKASTFITNIPAFLMKSLINKPHDSNVSHQPHTATEVRRPVYYHPLLADAIVDTIQGVVKYHRSTSDMLRIDVLESMIRYVDKLAGVESKAITDSGCQHGIANVEHWRVTKNSGRSFAARGFVGQSIKIEIGNCAAVAKDSRGNDLLIMWNNVGLVKNMSTLMDPYQIQAGGCKLECVVSPETPSPFIKKDGVVIPLSIGKDVTLNVRYPSDAELKNLPRIAITADEHWDRAVYMASPHNFTIPTISVNRNEVITKSKDLDAHDLEELDEQSDSDSEEDAPSVVKYQHTIPRDVWFWLDKHVLRRTAQATTAYTASRKGQDVLVRRTTHPATAQRRINDKASHDTLFSTIPAKGCGSTMLQVFATRKSRFLKGVPMTLKSQVLSAVEDFFQDVGIPSALRSDNAVENHSIQMKTLLRKKEVSEEFSEEFLQFQNRVERWIGFLKRSILKILEKTGAPADEWLMCAMYVIACHNKTARKGLHWRTPWEMVFGETPDVSEFVEYSFYQPVLYIHDPNEKGFPSPTLHKARYLGPAYSHGSVLTHWIRLPNGSKIAKSLLRADNNKTNQEEEEGTTDQEEPTKDQFFFNESDSSDSRGGSRMDFNEDSTSDQDDEAINEDADEVIGGEDVETGEPALTSVVNQSVWIKKGRALVIATAVKDMYVGNKRLITIRIKGEPDEAWHYDKFKKLRSVKDNNRDPQVPYAFVSFGKFKVTTGKKEVASKILIKVGWSDGSKTWEPFENLKEDDAVSLAGYAIKAFKNPAYSAYKKNRIIIDNAYDWASQFLVANNNSLNALTTSNPNVKFGVGLPKGIRGANAEDDQYDKDEFLSSTVQHQRWSAAMDKEQANFDRHDAFQYLPRGSPPPSGYQRMRCHFVFDVKSDGKFKARFCAGGDSVDATGVDSAMTVVETPSTRILFVIAEANGQEVLVGDLSSAYLHAYTKEKVYFICGPEWGKDKEGCIAIVIKAVYGLVGSAHAYHQHVFETMSGKGWNCSEIDSDIWMRKELTADGTYLWEYVAFYVDDFIIVSRDPAKIGKELNAIFSVKEITEPNKYLGANVKFVQGRFQFSSEDYLKEILSQLRGEGNIPHLDDKRPIGIRKFKTPMATSDHPEIDDSELLNEREHRVYQRLMGILQWLVSLGRFDICYSVSSLSRFNSAPRVGHMHRAIRVFGYLEQNSRKSIVINCDELTDLPTMDACLHADMKKKYPDAAEERSNREPEMLGKALNLTVYADADHAHDQVTRRSITGIIVFIGSTPIMAKSTRQGSVESSTYSAEFNSARAATELLIGLRLLLRSLGISQEKPSLLLGDNLGVVQNATLFTSALKKKHNAISFHRVREAVAAGTIAYAHINTALNLADIFTKPLDAVSFGTLRDTFMNRVSVLPWVDAIVDDGTVNENEREL